MKVWHVNGYHGRRKVNKTFGRESEARALFDEWKARMSAGMGRKDFLSISEGAE